jgi:protein O-GlcNAc transferase
VSASAQGLKQSFELALAHHRAGQLAEAGRLYRQILDEHPRHADALHMLALVAVGMGNRDEAEGLLRRAVAAAPREAEFHNTLGVLCQSSGRPREAEDCYRLAIKRRPGYAEAMSNLAGALNEQDRMLEACQWARRAIAIKPAYAEPFNNLGNAFLKQGLAKEATDAFRACTRFSPMEWRAWSNLLFVLHNVAEVSPQELFEEHVRVGAAMAASVQASAAPHANSRDSGRRLRVGYVSADLRMHSVSYFALPILRNHDRKAVEVFCYSDAPRADDVTAQAQSLADQWRPIGGLPDDAVAQTIRSDQIDVLVDLSGHTFGRPLVFCRKPAPVQVTYLGYPDTTGLPAMGYRLTDSFADPRGDADRRATESLVRLDPCSWCYSPPAAAPEVTARPAGPVTFGSFNALAKVNPQVVEIWAAVLKAAPQSRLLIKAFAMNEPGTRERFSAALVGHGVDPARLSIHPYSAGAQEHLSLYGDMDIALDPFPYNGTTTTCEALWMGVPVVTLAGTAHAGRVGVSLLHAVGLSELVAADRDEYVRIAVALGNDRPRLGALRAGLRERMRASPLMDGPAFCRRLEAAYLRMWRSWCDQAQL